MHLHQISGVALARLIKDREVTAEAALEYFIDRVERYNGPLNAVVVQRFDEARERARRADQALEQGQLWGPLHGVPMTVKETFEVAGWPTTAGIPEMRDHISEHNSVAVQKLLDAGAVIFGKTNVPPFASDLQSYNDIYGTSNNPWNTELTPGGSSGGAAAAVAAGLTPLELGSDIGGSIRTPAAFCGVCGLKPSWGVISTRGHIPGPPGALARRDISVSGPLARHVEDLEQALDVLAGPDQEEAVGWRLALPEARHRTLTDYRVGAWIDDPRCPVDRPIRDALEALLGTLRDQGVAVNDTARPRGFDLSEAHDVYYHLLTGTMGAGLPDGLYEKLRQAAGEASPRASDYRTLFARGATQSHAQWQRSHERRMRMRESWAEFFQQYDVLLCPVVQTLPFTHRHEPGPDQRTLTINGEEQPYMDILVWAGLAGAVYLPAVTLPIGVSDDGRPLAVQIIGPYLEDRTALAFARELQARLPAMPSPPM
ncbi:glutamyl-tRNA amidotransferase [Alcanivorax sp. N3-2A]|nr:glutamyl-tRNA amidotransferase [Alcanivorax sp. N3-2A]|tara:strand:- start:3350 stop:4804 length:1455 start_codon:yes stop_codon:yes gene_type:complete